MNRLFALLVSICACSASFPSGHASSLSSDDAVQARIEIERIYSVHRSGVVDESLVRAAARRTMERTWRLEAVLSRRFGVHVTEIKLQRELDRIARETDLPVVLQQMFAVLSDDPVLVAEVIARPSLVEREARAIYQTEELEGSWSAWRESLVRDVSINLKRTNGRDLLPPPAFRSLSLPVIDARKASVDGGAECVHEGWRSGGLTETVNSKRSPVSVWTGTEVIVWGGESEGGAPWMYNPSTDVWRMGSTVNAPATKFDAGAVWMGSKMAAFGGRTNDDGEMPNDLAFYDPVTDSWESGASGNLRADAASEWTGDFIVSIGGYSTGCDDIKFGLYSDFLTSTRSTYDASNDSWINAPTGVAIRRGATSTWSGTEVLFYGGRGENQVVLADGWAYNPTTDMLRRISQTGSPGPQDSPAEAWTGSEWIIFSGRDGAAYDPNADTWRALAPLPAEFPTYRSSPQSVWTGTEMIVWGTTNPVVDPRAAIYDPTSDSWRLSTDIGAPTQGYFENHSYWTGSRALFLDPTQNDVPGVTYDPVLDAWSPITTSEFRIRQAPVVVFTGTELLLHNPLRDMGRRYDLVLASWSPMSSRGTTSPFRVVSYRGVWNGSSMFIFGETELPDLPSQDSGRYDLATDTWHPVSQQDMPFFAGRPRIAEWIDSSIVYWGEGSQEYFGSRYDPDTDMWRSMSQPQGGPTPSGPLSGNVVGDELYVFFDADPIWVYDASQDLWTATSSPAEPVSFRRRPAWSGDQFYFWKSDTMASYRPAEDQWDEHPIGFDIGQSVDGTLVWDGSGVIYAPFQETVTFDPCGRLSVQTRSQRMHRWDAGLSSYEPLAGWSPIPKNDNNHYFWTGSEILEWSSEDGMGAFYSSERLQNPDVDADGVGACVDCDDDDPERYPGSLDCDGDGVDDDCNAEVDDTPLFIAYQDVDGDGFGDAGQPMTYCEAIPTGFVLNDIDCEDSQPDVWRAPEEIEMVLAADDRLDWPDLRLDWGTSSATVFQVATGLASQLKSPSRYLQAQCAAPSLTTNSVPITDDPPVANGFYYLVRGKNVCGDGTWGASFNDERDQFLVACP